MIKRPVPLPASRSLKILYCCCLLASLPAMLFGASGWVGMILGFSGGGLLWPIFAIWRFIKVVRKPEALDAYEGGWWAGLLRNLGIFLMFAGTLAACSIFFVRPLTRMFFTHQGDDGIAYVIVGLVLFLLSLSGAAGIGLFELSRYLGRKPTPATASQKTLAE